MLMNKLSRAVFRSARICGRQSVSEEWMCGFYPFREVPTVAEHREEDNSRKNTPLRTLYNIYAAWIRVVQGDTR